MAEETKTDPTNIRVVMNGDGSILLDAKDLIIHLLTETDELPKAARVYRHCLARQLASIVKNPFPNIRSKHAIYKDTQDTRL